MNDVERDELLKHLDKKTDEVMALTTQIRAILFDTNGSPGLCSTVNSIKAQMVRVWIALTVVSIGIGGGTFGIIKFLMGG